MLTKEKEKPERLSIHDIQNRWFSSLCTNTSSASLRLYVSRGASGKAQAPQERRAKVSAKQSSVAAVSGRVRRSGCLSILYYDVGLLLVVFRCRRWRYCGYPQERGIRLTTNRAEPALGLPLPTWSRSRGSRSGSSSVRHSASSRRLRIPTSGNRLLCLGDSSASTEFDHIQST